MIVPPPPPPPSVWMMVVSRSRSGSLIVSLRFCFGASTLCLEGGSSCPGDRLHRSPPGPGPVADERFDGPARLDGDRRAHPVLHQPVAADIAIEMDLGAERLDPVVERAGEAIDGPARKRRIRAGDGKRRALLGGAYIAVLARDGRLDRTIFLVVALPSPRRSG